MAPREATMFVFGCMWVGRGTEDHWDKPGDTHRDREIVELEDRMTRTSLVVTYQSPD